MDATGMDQDGPYAGSFGREIRESLFCLDREAAFTNHGSFGTVPRPVLDAHLDLLRQVEAQPDGWFRHTLKPLFLHACEAAGKFIGASREEVVLVENATSAVNIIVRGLNLTPKDGILATTFTYEACKNAVRVACKDSGAECHFMEIKLPVASRESIVQQYVDYLDQHPNVTFALLDHITSPSAVVLPVKEIVRVCHERGVVVMVDGAHAPGQLPLDMKDIGADYYTGNFHKWLFCPRGCAALYARNGLQDTVQPLVVSHLHFLTLHDRFFMQATRDYTSYCMAPTAIDFFKKLGGLPAISAYNSSLVSWAADMLCQRLHLHQLPVPPDLKAPYLSLVSLPDCLGPPTREREKELQNKLLLRYNVVTVICVVDGQLWCRICAQVYNVKEDYVRLAEALEQEILEAQMQAQS